MAQTKWHQREHRGHLTGLWAALMAALLVTMMELPAAAADGNRVAFVVGIGSYDNLSNDKQLKNAVNDADGVSKKLTDIGFRVVKAPNLTRSNFNAQWQDVLNGLTKDDTFLLFFSGHGVQIDGQNYLLPRDIPYIAYGRSDQLKREAISLNELLSDLTTGDRTHPARSVVILDACRDNPLIPPGYKNAATRGGLAKMSDPDGIFVIYSAGSNRTALDRLSPSDPVKYSVFTRVLLPLMDRSDLTIQKLSTELRHQVAQLAQNAGHEQRPSYYDGILGQFCLPGCATNADMGNVGLKENFAASVRPALQNEITGKDGAPMVLIPAGTFMMGSTKDEVDRAIRDCVKKMKKDQPTCEGWYNPELPQHKVRMDTFYLDKYEVTNRIFQQFVRQAGYRSTAEKEGSAQVFVEGKGWQDMKGASWQQPEGGQTVFASDRSEHPVVSVSWDDADAFCRWADKRLPTEAEWEYATRAGTTTRYWWGNGSPGSRQVENIADETAKNLLSLIMTGYDDGSLRTAPVGSYEANSWGLHDMSGNVAEWTTDWFDATYYKNSPERKPKGPSSGTYRVLRGGSWLDVPVNVRSVLRYGFTPTLRFDDIGFRCAQDRPK